MNKLSVLKRLETLEAKAARLPEGYTGEPHPLWVALENDPEVLESMEVIRTETGLDPYDGDHNNQRGIWETSLTNPRVAEAEDVFRRKLFAAMAEHTPPGVPVPER